MVWIINCSERASEFLRKQTMKRSCGLSAMLVLCAAMATLPACAPLVLGGAVGGTLVATDRRTSGMQLEDEGVELRAVSRVNDALGVRGHINLTSYNLQVLITGEVPSEQDKALVQQIIGRVDNVKSIVNELGVMANSTLTQRASDSLITGKVKASFVDAPDLFANAFKVVTERGVTYLMGRVTQREANRATEMARSTSGVQKLVRVFEIISEDELTRTLPQPPKTEQPAAKK
jgi:osmotically-inducible protein OsmY